MKNPDGSQGYASNPLKGKCRHACWYCYVNSFRKRFKRSDEMTWHPDELQSWRRLRKPSTIFVGSAYDIYGEWVPDEYIDLMHQVAEELPQHIFVFLTKNAEREWWLSPMPLNVWFGGTVSHSGDKYNGYNAGGCGTRKSFISFEPVLNNVVNGGSELYADGVLPIHKNTKWVIIGALTRNGRPVLADNGGTRLEWVLPIIEQVDKFNIPVFLKDNLMMLYPELPNRQEIPWLKGGN